MSQWNLSLALEKILIGVNFRLDQKCCETASSANPVFGKQDNHMEKNEVGLLSYTTHIN